MSFACIWEHFVIFQIWTAHHIIRFSVWKSNVQLEYESGVIIMCSAESISQFESFGVLKVLFGYLI